MIGDYIKDSDMSSAKADYGVSYVIEEGLNERTTVWDDPVEGDKCGLKTYYPLY